jgi:predicted alpha/beta hydrolase family esterase
MRPKADSITSAQATHFKIISLAILILYRSNLDCREPPFPSSNALMNVMIHQPAKPASAWRGAASTRRPAKAAAPRTEDAWTPESGGPTRPILIIPGLYNSGPDHWQTHWERRIPGAIRVEQSDWLRPDLADWTATLAEAVRRRPGAVLVAHSLGCALVCHLARISNGRNIGGALLVAPADVNRDGPNAEFLRGFSPLPLGRLPFPSTAVISRDDPYVAHERGKMFAGAWGSTLVDLGAAGHINADSGHGPWPEGLAYLDALLERLDPAPERGARDQPRPGA